MKCRLWFAFLGALGAAGTWCLSARGFPEPPVKRPPLGAQVVVVPGSSGRYLVSIAFSQTLPRSAVEARFHQVEAGLGAKAGALQIDSRKGVSTMSFATTSPLVDVQSGTVRFEAFVRALIDLGNLQVTFAVPERFTIQKSRFPVDNDVEIAVSDEKGLVNIAVNKKDQKETLQAGAESSRQILAGRGGKLWSGVLILLLAVGAGLAAYRVARRMVA